MFSFKLGSRNNTSNGEHSSFGAKHVSDTSQLKKLKYLESNCKVVDSET